MQITVKKSQRQKLIEINVSINNKPIVVLEDIFILHFPAQHYNLVDIACFYTQVFIEFITGEQCNTVLVKNIFAHIFAKPYHDLIINSSVPFLVKRNIKTWHVAHPVQVNPFVWFFAAGAVVPAQPSLLKPQPVRQRGFAHRRTYR